MPDVTRILIVHPEPRVRAALADALRRDDAPVSLSEAASGGEALELARRTAPRFVFLDLHDQGDLALEVARELFSTDRRIVGLYDPLLLAGDEASLLRRAARAGVGDFVPLPADASELHAALRAAPGPSNRDAGRVEGRVVSFLAAKGGVGATTLAVAVGSRLALSPGWTDRVALLDAAVQFGTAAAFLDAAPDRDLADLAADLDHLEALSPYLHRHEETGLRLLAAPREPRAAEAITPQDLSRILIQLRRRFGLVIVDCPPVLDLLSLAVLDLSETVVVVTEATAPAVVVTSRLLGLLDELGIAPSRLRLVVNRHQPSEGQLSETAISEQLHREVDLVVPYDRAVVTGAAPGLFSGGGRRRSAFQESVASLVEGILEAVAAEPVGG